MSNFLGSRISLISKSDIRYVGVLHEINSEESTVSLENVRSFGTEGRKGVPDQEVGPSEQVYEYIVFRGTDVKDLRVENAPTGTENTPPTMPEDPAIVGARPRPNAEPQNQPPPPPPGYGQPPPPNQNNFYPPPGNWGPAGNMPYPPPPGWFPPGHPGQHFPPPPGWNGNNYQFPPGQPMPPGSGSEQSVPGQAPGAQDPKAPGQGNAAQRQQSGTPTPQGQAPPKNPQPARNPSAPTPPVESKPTAEQVKATAATLDQAPPSGPAPTGPKNNRVKPVMPLAASKGGQQQPVVQEAATAHITMQAGSAGGNNNAVRDATEAAKAAVAMAMANMNAAGGAQPAHVGNVAMDNLTHRVDEMRVGASRGGHGGRGGRGRGGRPAAKVEVPDSDFDFEQSNAKFNKGDLVKEAIATGSPQTEAPPVEVDTSEAPEPVENAASAYNKKSSFFDNISSEAKDRADKSAQKAGGREWRGEEQRKNMETFGQGSVDGGYRGYRGRGRGRGRGHGGRGRGGGYRGRGGQNAAPAQN